MIKKINSILFTTFSVRNNGQRTSINGMIEPLTSYFLPRAKKFVLLEQPHPGSDSVIPFVEIYEDKRLIRKSRFFLSSVLLYPFLKLTNASETSVVFKIRDFFSSLEFVISGGRKYKLFIGLESINALSGIVLKKFRLVEKVVYYVSDFSPERYKPKWFNDLYLWLDRFASKHSDYIWDVSLAMMPARIKVGLDPKKAAPVVHVPNALFPKQIINRHSARIVPNSLVFVGTLGKINGPDLAIKALKLVLKSVPGSTLHIYGDGEPDITRLKKLTGKLKLNDKVTFHGFISDQVELSRKTSMYAIGLAPYLAVPGSPRWWADATKIRLYLASGLPVITTQVPPLGKEIEKDEAGLVAKDTPKAQAKATIELLKNKQLYKTMRRNAIKRAKDNTWENTYSRAIEKMGLAL